MTTQTSSAQVRNSTWRRPGRSGWVACADMATFAPTEQPEVLAAMGWLTAASLMTDQE